MKTIYSAKTNGKPSVRVDIPETIAEVFEKLMNSLNSCLYWNKHHPAECGILNKSIDQAQKEVEVIFMRDMNRVVEDVIRAGREELASLEHEQWIHWSKAIFEREGIKPETRKRWSKLWVPYEELDEKDKEHDRIWADKVLKSLLGEEKETK